MVSLSSIDYTYRGTGFAKVLIRLDATAPLASMIPSESKKTFTFRVSDLTVDNLESIFIITIDLLHDKEAVEEVEEVDIVEEEVTLYQEYLGFIEETLNEQYEF